MDATATATAGGVSTVLMKAAAAWSDPSSDVRRQARTALAGGQWPPQTVETALDSALFDFESAAGRSTILAAQLEPLRALVILPGNIIGPAVSCAFCAAVAGATITLKSSHAERQLAEIVATQFEGLGAPFAGTVTAKYWTGGDARREDAAFNRADIIVVFGEDATVSDVEQRAPSRAVVRSYGNGYSIGYIGARANVREAAEAAALDIALFDQRGCMSPQTIYVQGDERRCVVFAEALDAGLGRLTQRLPRAQSDAAEKEAVAAAARRLTLAALPLDGGSALFLGPPQGDTPSHIVAAQSFSKPVCMGFGRIVVVKPCYDAAAAAAAASALGRRLETVGIAGGASETLGSLFKRAGAARVCALGGMQRPPFGYRPKISDFTAAA